VSDPTAEAERVAQALRVAGYAVVDVPLSMLVARVAVQLPRIILIDADGDGALDAVGRMRELPDADDIHVLFIARPGGAIASPEEALAHEGSGLFVRPVDVPALVRKVEALAGGPRSPSAVPSYGPYGREAYEAAPSLPPASMRSVPVTAPTPVPPPLSPRTGARSPSEPPSGGTPSLRRVVGLAPPVSAELQQLLADAELRVQVRAESEAALPSPEDEIEAVLPAELLAALDEPMESDDDEDEVAVVPVRPTMAPSRERTNDGGAPRTTGASTTGSGTPGAGKRRHTHDDGSGSPPAHTHGGTQAGSTGGGISTTGGGSEPRQRTARPGDPVVREPTEARERHEAREVAEPRHRHEALDARDSHDVRDPRDSRDARGGTRPLLDRTPAPPSSWRDATPMPGSVDPRSLPAQANQSPTMLGPGEALPVAARAIASRTGGSLCFVEGAIERRLVLREGDIVTAASSADEETLLGFLGARGELPRETVRRLGSKFPPFGRHAGAALVARGYLNQDQMWPTLRAHAEWVLAHVLQMSEGRLIVEERPPGRLAGEPSVFGGSTGAEVFVELVRRIVSPADAVERLGGGGSRVGEGRASALLVECALAPEEVARIRSAPGATLAELLDAAPEGDLATVIFALAQLEVIEVLPSIREHSADSDAGAVGDAALDAEAIRERVRARAQLVDDGDYFAVLGVARDATGYEVRRAFLELRRAFDASRMLTPEVADLAADVRKIAVVLEEAYEILKDTARRDRYRRAIEAVPEGG
jgi:hypothetical protein